MKSYEHVNIVTKYSCLNIIWTAVIQNVWETYLTLLEELMLNFVMSPDDIQMTPLGLWQGLSGMDGSGSLPFVSRLNLQPIIEVDGTHEHCVRDAIWCNDILADCICVAYVRQAETGAGEQSEQVTVEARNVWKTVCIQTTGALTDSK